MIFNSEEIVETICSETQFEIKTKSTCLRKDNQERDSDSDKLRPYGFITFNGEAIVDKICTEANFVIKTKSVRLHKWEY